MDTLFRNLRHAVRSLAHTPGFSITVVLTLALGIGAGSAVFSALDAILLRPLPFPEADRLMSLNQVQEQRAVANVAPVRLEEWNERNVSFEALTGYYTEDVSDASGDLPERLRQASVAPRFLEVWGVTPKFGRGFVAADHQQGAALVAMISERYWQRRFAADPKVVGTEVRIGEQSYLLAGVMPADFAFPDRDVDVWVPTRHFPFVMNRFSAWYRGFGRLKAGVTPDQARADLAAVQARLAEQYPESDRDLRAEIVPYQETLVGGIRGSMWLLFASVSVLLLIACTNIAALLLARAARRRQEITVHFALGSSRWSVIARMLTETGVLVCLGTLAGLALAFGAAALFRALAPALPRVEEIAVNGTLLWYTLGSTVGVTLLCGLVPALRSTGGSIVAAGRAQVSSRHSLQWVFVGVQVALSVPLLAGAGLLVRSFQELGHVDPGFDPNGILTFRLTGTFGGEHVRDVQIVEALIDGLSAVPGIESVASSSPVPGVSNDRSGFQFGGAEFTVNDESTESHILAEYRVVSSGYFDTMRIPLLAGAPCRRQVAGGAPEVVVNTAFVNRYLSDRSPIGVVLRYRDTVSRIAGVAADARDYGLDRAPVPTAYGCTTMTAFPPLALLVRTKGDSQMLVGAIRQKVKELEPSRSIYDVAPLTSRMGAEYAADRLRTVLLAAFAGAALALVCLGIYGTLSYLVSLRRREVGLRVALGAIARNIVGQFLWKALRVVGIASGIGLALSFLFTRTLSGMLYGISPNDPVTLAAVVAVVLLVATAAAFIPALRAARIDPMQALREE